VDNGGLIITLGLSPHPHRQATALSQRRHPGRSVPRGYQLRAYFQAPGRAPLGQLPERPRSVRRGVIASTISHVPKAKDNISHWISRENRVRVLVQPQTSQRYERHATEVTIGGEQLRLTARERPDGTLGQVAIDWGGRRSGAVGLLDSYGTALSLGLEHGVPLRDLLRPGLGLRFAPDGDTGDPEIPRTYSAVDYCCRRLAIDWLPYPERAALGVFTTAERGRQLERQANIHQHAGLREGTCSGSETCCCLPARA
jgi:hypothetical protein